jgi:hypothetical protein
LTSLHHSSTGRRLQAARASTRSQMNS